jgi:hypothetical protein
MKPALLSMKKGGSEEPPLESVVAWWLLYLLGELDPDAKGHNRQTNQAESYPDIHDFASHTVKT